MQLQARKDKKIAKEWEKFWDDLLFLNNLRKIAFVNRRLCKGNEMDNVVKAVSNPSVINDTEDCYFIGYPDDYGGKKRSDDQSTISSMSESLGLVDLDNLPSDEDYDDEGTAVSDAVSKTSGTTWDKGFIRVLDRNWIKENIDRAFITQLKRPENNHRPQMLNEATLKKIRNEIKRLRYKRVTHIYKYQCKTKLKFKFLNAIPKNTQRNGRQAKDNFNQSKETK